MIATWWISAMGLGLLSSLHCVGMCGPLALSLPVQHLPKYLRILSLVTYQLGRVVTYASLGMVAGAAGRGIYLAGFQQYFSIIMGVLVLLMLILYYGYRRSVQPGWLSRFYLLLQGWMNRLWAGQRHAGSFLLLGMANGLLPCGMVYAALATAVTAGDVDYSIGFMALFGLGTWPAMLGLSLSGQMISPKTRYRLRQLTPAFIGLSGVLLLLRGLDLGIPYLSPELGRLGGEVMMSCK